METDLLALVKQDGFRAIRQSTSRGGQWNGPCPFCQGRDRFRVQPHQGLYGWFACSQCARQGNAIDYLILKRGMPKGAALAAVGWVPKEQRDISDAAPPFVFDVRPQWEAPPECWQKTAGAFVRYCQDVLWSESGQGVRAYLSQRGLTDHTIREASLGYYPRSSIGSAKAWGRPVKLSQGIVIPWFLAGGIWRLTIRNEQITGVHSNKRYMQVTGGSNGLYRSEELIYRRPLVVVTEGEFDALSILQECGDTVAVVATGTTGGSHTPRWLSLLAQQERVLIAFDAEEKGEKAAKWWFERLENVQRLRPWWKDANQMLQDGADLRQWLASDRIVMSTVPGMPITSECINEAPIQVDPIADVTTIADVCIQCHASITDENLDFCYTETGVCYCIPCRNLQSLVEGTESTSEQQTIDSTHVLDIQSPLASIQQIGELTSFFPDMETLAVDLETTGLNARTCKVVSITIGTPEYTVIIDTRLYYCWSEEAQLAYRQALQQFFQQPHICWIGHNLKFDWQFLLVHFGISLRNVYDTMLAEQLLEHREISLKATVARYQLGEMRKEERSWFIGLDSRPDWYTAFPENQCTYMRQDVVQAYRVYQKQHVPIEKGQLTRVVALENSALPALAAMEVHGALIDVTRWKNVLQAKRNRQTEIEPALQEGLIHPLQEARLKKYQEYQQAVRNIWSSPSSTRPSCPADPLKPINLSSADDLKEALTLAGIRVESTREEILEAHKSHVPIIGLLLEWRKLQHFCDAFGENLLAHIQADGRIHANFRQIGAVSGRVICNTPNLQQIPKKADEESDDVDLRRCFVSAPGFLVLTADLSNIELRILADFAQDKAMLRFFAEGKGHHAEKPDLHAETARLMFGLPEETDTKKHLYKGVAVRSIAKTINFGLAYGMGAQGLASRAGVSLDEARALIRKYFDTYAGVARFLKQSGASALQKGYATTASGRKRSFPTTSIQSQSERGRIERAAKNHPIQGTNADILKRALALLYTTLPESVHIMLTVHDEIALECPSELVEETTQILQSAMVQACQAYLPTVHIPEPDVLVDTCWRKG